MKFGIREVCDVTFTKLSGNGPTSFDIASAKMSTIESASTMVYAQGGKGNSRLIAWEGEKTLTFTVEDALITLETFEALTGADKTTGEGLLAKFTIKTTSFAGTYKVEATTLFRDTDGEDHAAKITIPKAKLQTTLNLSMASTGDPSTFTFTMDALANESDELCVIEIYQSKDVEASETTVAYINGTKVSITGVADTDEITLRVVNADGAITISGGDDATVTPATVPTKVGANESLTNGTVDLDRGDSIELKKGAVSHWYIV